MNYAYRDTTCEDCADLIQQDEPIYFTDEGRLCGRCAERDGLVCPDCRSQKKSQYRQCYNCRPGPGFSQRNTSASVSDIPASPASRRIKISARKKNH